MNPITSQTMNLKTTGTAHFPFGYRLKASFLDDTDLVLGWAIGFDCLNLLPFLSTAVGPVFGLIAPFDGVFMVVT